ncbi:unnamed protein product [Owenia fusiformis]|uniref:CUB domain-containing protein n=1 Tax=Owenia fusiformis TaxID=6347 RepID=A0A8S4PIN9_OWEFU|nr:unnamed protein product [Owenia fusiformis]
MRSHSLWVTILWLYTGYIQLVRSYATTRHKTIILNDTMDNNVTAISGALVKSSQTFPDHPTLVSTIFTPAEEGQQFQLEFKQFDVPKTSHGCEDYLTICETQVPNFQDHCKNKLLYRYCGDLKGLDKSHVINSQPNMSLTVLWRTGRRRSEDQGFSFHLTAYTSSREQCNGSSSFSCSKEICIDKNLQCDGMRNCLEVTSYTSDEFNCSYAWELSGNMTALEEGPMEFSASWLISIAAIVGLLALTIIAICSKIQSKLKARRKSNERKAAEAMLNDSSNTETKSLTKRESVSGAIEETV